MLVMMLNNIAGDMAATSAGGATAIVWKLLMKYCTDIQNNCSINLMWVNYTQWCAAKCSKTNSASSTAAAIQHH